MRKPWVWGIAAVVTAAVSAVGSYLAARSQIQPVVALVFAGFGASAPSESCVDGSVRVWHSRLLVCRSRPLCCGSPSTFRTE